MQEQDTTPTEQQAGDCEHDFISVLNADFDECRYCNRQFPHQAGGPMEAWEVSEGGYEFGRPYIQISEAGTPYAVRVGATSLIFKPQSRGSHRGERRTYFAFTDEARAKAHLLAAAPQMLAALEAARPFLLYQMMKAQDALDIELHRRACDSVNAIDAVIAAARGGAS